MKGGKDMKKLANKLVASAIMLLAVFVCLCVGIFATSCKATRTVTTTATCTICTDSLPSTATITTKTVEDYQGVKKK